MYTETTIEWWKLRIYQDVSNYLNNPVSENQVKLTSALESYRAFCQQHKPVTGTSYDDYEQLISA